MDCLWKLDELMLLFPRMAQSLCCVPSSSFSACASLAEASRGDLALVSALSYSMRAKNVRSSSAVAAIESVLARYLIGREKRENGCES
jgi:hypothetical protein